MWIFSIYKKNLNICIVTPIFPPEIGGPATYSYELATLLKDKHKITIVTFGEKVENIEEVKIYNLKLYYPFFGTIFRQWSVFYKLFKIRKEFECIYAQDPLTVGAVSLFFSRIFKKRLILKFVGDVVWETATRNKKTNKRLEDFIGESKEFSYAMLWKIQRFVLCNSNIIIVPSEYRKSLLVKFYKVSPNKCYVIYNAVSLEIAKQYSLSSGSTKKDDIINLVTIGRLIKGKHIDGIIQVVEILKTKGFKIKCKIIGEGEEYEYLQQLTLKLGLEENIIFTGKLSHKETLKLLSESDIFILNSSHEGLPHVIIEAMSLNIPVVSTDIPGSREIAIHEYTSLLIPLHNNNALANSIVRLIDNKELREKLVVNAYNFVQEKFTWKNNIDMLENIISEGKL